MNPLMNSNTQYAFVPEPQESPDLPHPILIIIEGLAQPITTSIVALTLNDAANVCARLTIAVALLVPSVDGRHSFNSFGMRARSILACQRVSLCTSPNQI